MKGIIALLYLLFCASFSFGQSLFPVRDTTSGLFGYKNAETFKWGISPMYDEAEPFMEGIALIRQNDAWGLIDKKGKFIIPPIYKHLEGEKFFTYQKQDSSGIISSKGKILLSGKFDHLYYEPSLGSALLMQDNYYGYWDTLGNYIPPFSKYELSFENGIAYFNSGNSQGFINKSGTRIIEVQQGELWDVSPHGFISNSNGKECVYDSEGKQIGECSLDKVIQLRKENILFVKDGKYGLMNYKGETLLSGEYKSMSPFNEAGLSIAKKNGKYGLVDTQGKVVFPLEQQYIEEFGKDFNRLFGKYKTYSPYTVFKSNDFYGVLNESGEIIKAPQFKMAMVQAGGELTFLMHDTLRVWDLNKNKKISLARNYTFVHGKTVFCFFNEDKCGIAGKDGKVIVSPIYKSITPIGSTGNWIVKDNASAGIIDSIGHLISPLIYSDIKILDEIYKQYFHTHGDVAWDTYLYLTTKSGKVGIAKESGKIFIDTAYANASVYDDDGQCWFVKENNKWKIINEEGKKLSVTLSTPSVFNQGTAIAKKGKKYGLITPLGKTILPFIYDRITEEPFGTYYIQKKGQWGLVNRNGKILATPQFSAKTSFNFSHAFVKKRQVWGVITFQGVFKPGFQAIQEDSSNVKEINNSKICSYSFSNHPYYDEISFDLLQHHDSSGFPEKINGMILNFMENYFSESKSNQEVVLVIPEKLSNPTSELQYHGLGVEISNVTKNTITLNYFQEAFDREKEINTSKDSMAVYRMDGNNLKKLSLHDLFIASDYLSVLNAVVIEESKKLGLSPIGRDSMIVFDEANFMLLNTELVLHLNEEFFTDKNFVKNVGIIVPYDRIKSIINKEGPLKEFF